MLKQNCDDIPSGKNNELTSASTSSPKCSAKESNDGMKHAILGLYSSFVSSVNPVMLSDHHIENGIVSMEEWNRIKSKEVTEADICRALLNHLYIKSHPRTFLIIRKALEIERHWILEEIDKRNKSDPQIRISRPNSNRHFDLEVEKTEEIIAGLLLRIDRLNEENKSLRIQLTESQSQVAKLTKSNHRNTTDERKKIQWRKEADAVKNSSKKHNDKEQKAFCEEEEEMAKRHSCLSTQKPKSDSEDAAEEETVHRERSTAGNGSDGMLEQVENVLATGHSRDNEESGINIPANDSVERKYLRRQSDPLIRTTLDQVIANTKVNPYILKQLQLIEDELLVKPQENIFRLVIECKRTHKQSSGTAQGQSQGQATGQCRNESPVLLVDKDQDPPTDKMRNESVVATLMNKTCKAKSDVKTIKPPPKSRNIPQLKAVFEPLNIKNCPSTTTELH